MDAPPRMCARLLLLSLLCATGFCQRSKSECSRSRSVCVLPLVLPHGVCAPLLGSRNADPHADKNCCVSFLLCSLSPALGVPLLLPRCCFVASFH